MQFKLCVTFKIFIFFKSAVYIILYQLDGYWNSVYFKHYFIFKRKYSTGVIKPQRRTNLLSFIINNGISNIVIEKPLIKYYIHTFLIQRGSKRGLYPLGQIEILTPKVKPIWKFWEKLTRLNCFQIIILWMQTLSRCSKVHSYI